MERTAILVLGHGSRQARANDEFEALVAAFRQRRPDLDVGHAYIELAQPLLAQGLSSLAARADRVVVIPLFLFAAGHVKHDVPRAVDAARTLHPQVRFDAARAIGVDRDMVEIALDRCRAVVTEGERGETVLVAVGRGSSDPDANGDFCKLVRLLAEAGRFAWAEPSFVGITTPLFERAAERAALTAPGRILVLPYFLFDNGVLIERLARQVREFAERHPDVDVRLAPHLGADDRVLALMEDRLAEALAGEAHPRCEACPQSAAA